MWKDSRCANYQKSQKRHEACLPMKRQDLVMERKKTTSTSAKRSFYFRTTELSLLILSSFPSHWFLVSISALNGPMYKYFQSFMKISNQRVHSYPLTTMLLLSSRVDKYGHARMVYDWGTVSSKASKQYLNWRSCIPFWIPHVLFLFISDVTWILLCSSRTTSGNMVKPTNTCGTPRGTCVSNSCDHSQAF